MSARRILLAAALCAIALPAAAQEVAQPSALEQTSSQSTDVVMSPSSIGDRPLTVTLVKPTAGQQLVVGTTTPMWADAEDEDDMIQSVWFQVDGTTVSTTSDGIGSWVVTAGSHSVRACASNYHEPMKTACTATITVTGVPNQLPAVSLTAPANGAVYMAGAAVPMTASASDSDGTIQRVEFWVDGVNKAQDTSSPYTYNWTATGGSHTLQARAVDDANGTTTSASVGITGNVAPTVSLTGPANGAIYTVGTTVPVTATASDSYGGSIARVEFWVDGTNVFNDTASPYAYNWTATAGSHGVLAKAVDNLGAATTTSSITVTGNVLPTVDLTGPANGAIYTVGATVPMTATASDSDGSVTSVEFWVDGANVATDTASPYAYNWTATAGAHTVQAKAVDNRGARVADATITITGNVLPTVDLTSPANGAVYTVGATVSMTATASDSDGSVTSVEFWVDGAKIATDTTSPYAYNWTATAGAHTVQAKVVDNRGARVADSAITITGNVLPTTSLTSPASGAVYRVGTTVPMAATASDSDGTIARVEFWVDATKVGEDTTSPYSYNWAATAGAHGLKAKAVDNLGGTTTSSTIAMTGNVAPTVDLTSPANGAIYTVGTTVPMTATASDSDGSVASVEFWVDGIKVGTDTTSPYAYNWTATAGTHTVQAKVVDDDGAMVADAAITITGNVLPTVSLTSPADDAVYLVGATVPMTATANDSGGSIARVEFWIDGAKAVDDTTSPYAYNWTATLGAHTLQAKAIDNLGATTTSSTIAMNGNYAPAVTLTGPADDSTYTAGTAVPMTATASDNGGSVARVEFWVDGAKAGEDASSPYAYNWTATAGAHSVLAKAVDNLGTTTGTPAITVNVNAPPTVSLTAPANGASPLVGTYLTLSANASDAGGSVTRVEFLVDGTLVGWDYTSPYAYDWPVTAGAHTVQARAIDNLGATTTTAAIGLFGNAPPTVALTAPASGAYYAAGATVPLAATADDSDGNVARVEFWVDGAKVADDTGSPYAFNWTMTDGSHTLQAKAVDDHGAVTVSGTATIHTLPENATALTRRYFYNAYQELCGVDEPETGTTLMGYDGAGNLAWSASGLPAGTACSSDGNTTAINARKAARTYDARNRISTLSFPDLNGNQSWRYTPDGLPASVTTYNDGGASSVVNSYLYNRRRLPVSETQQVDSLTTSVGYGYDPNGHLSALTYPDSLTVGYAPNALGQPTQAGTYATGVQYYPNGAIQQFTYGNGIVHTLVQNARGLPDRSRDLNGTTPVHDDSYDYDPVGNVLAISDAVSGNRGDRDMVYDDLNRLTSATSPMFGTATYTYDVVDNLRHVTVTGGPQARDQDYVYDQNNRLTNITSGGATVVGLGYDVQGNLANKSGVTYTFDYGNRLRAGGPETYRYDVQGRRARSSSSAGLVYSLYAQSGQLLFQRDERSGKRRQYVYLGGSLVAESDVPLAGGTATVTYQHTDALGSSVATTNASKIVLQRSEYEPYGYLLNRPMEDGPGYTGHVTDAATGLVYMQQRYYDPFIGAHFLSADPVTAHSPGGVFNRYWYADGNPYKFTDPDGRRAGDPYKWAGGDFSESASSSDEDAGSKESQESVPRSQMMQRPIASPDPNDYDHSDETFHEYIYTYQGCRSGPSCNIDDVAKSVEPTSAPGFGIRQGYNRLIFDNEIYHYSFKAPDGSRYIMNLTTPNHMFRAGAVVTHIYAAGGGVMIQTHGFGYGTSASKAELNHAIGLLYFGVFTRVINVGAGNISNGQIDPRALK